MKAHHAFHLKSSLQHKLVCNNDTLAPFCQEPFATKSGQGIRETVNRPSRSRLFIRTHANFPVEFWLFPGFRRIVPYSEIETLLQRWFDLWIQTDPLPIFRPLILHLS